jgi:hypothetical protein
MLCPECGEMLAPGPLDARRAANDGPPLVARIRRWIRRKAEDDGAR